MTVTITIELNQQLADMLRSNSSQNLYADQADRFETLGDKAAPAPTDPVFDSGTMHWCATAADALMLRAYEEASGATAILLWDLATSSIEPPAGGYDDGYVVLSSAGWRWGAAEDKEALQSSDI